MVGRLTAIMVTVPILLKRPHSSEFWSANMEFVLCLTMLLKVFCFVLLIFVSDVLDTDDRWLKSVICFHLHCVQWVRSSSSPGSQVCQWPLSPQWGCAHSVLHCARRMTVVLLHQPRCLRYSLLCFSLLEGFCLVTFTQSSHEEAVHILYSHEDTICGQRRSCFQWSPTEKSGPRIATLHKY